MKAFSTIRLRYPVFSLPYCGLTLFALFVFFYLPVAYSFSTNNGKQKVIWLTDDKNDIHFFESQTNHSISHDTLAMLLRELTSENIELQLASVARIATQLTQTDNTCVAGRMKTPERIQQHLFSIPFNLHPMPKLYFNRDEINLPPEALNEKGQIISIKRILDNNPNKRLAQLEALSFGKDIDSMVNELIDGQLHSFSVDNRYQAKTQLIVGGFVDMIITYPVDFIHKDIDLNDYPKIGFTSFATQTPFSISHVACSKSKLGEQMIKHVNDVLHRLQRDKAFLDAHLRYLSNTEQNSFIQFYNDTFNTEFPAR